MTRPIQISDLLDLAVPGEPTLSPDGSSVVYALRQIDAAADRQISSLWITDATGAARVLTRGPADSSPVFSPEGDRVAFLRDGQPWILPLRGGEPTPVAKLPLGAQELSWSPDGEHLAFLAPIDPASPVDTASPITPGTIRTGAEDAPAKSSDAPIVIDRIDYLEDGHGFVRTLRSQLHVVNVSSGVVRQLTDGREHVASLAWSPDGTSLAFAAHPEGVDDLETRSAVHVISATETAGRPRLIAFADGYAGTVSYSPEGDKLAVVGWIGELSGHAGVFIVDLASGEVTDLAHSLDRNVMPGGAGYPGARPVFSPAGELVFAVRDRGCTQLYAASTNGGQLRLVTGGDGDVISGMSASGSRAAIVLTTSESFGEVVLIDLADGSRNVVTAHGANVAELELYPRVRREFRISDGTTVDAWVIRAAETNGPSPLLVDVHGGPHNAWNGAADEAHLYHQELAARGWTILLINPRGSDGYGEEFFTAVFGAWGTSDANDFLEPIDTLVAEGLVDAARLAITGYSYGGYMSCYLTSRDGRFAAAVAGGVVSDLVSMSGTSDDSHMMNVLEFGAFPWNPEDRDRLAASSPFTSVDQVETPTLILHGENDVRCPLGQAEQWYQALRERKVPTQLVVYPGGSHLFPLNGKPSHRVDYASRVVQWVQRYATGSTVPRPAPLDEAHWERRLAALAARHNVPGAQLGILRLGNGNGNDDELVRAAMGTLNQNIATGAPATIDSVFQIGSITKTWTATVIMKLIEDGLFALDSKVVDVLPGFTLSTQELTTQTTIWHLLTHTSGLDGDIFTDTGRGDDCLEKYVADLATAAQIHPIGATWSYCNSGYSVLGRVIEQVTGLTWDAAMREHLFAPLGLTSTVTLPEEAILFAAAVGHMDVDGTTIVTPAWVLPRSLGPAGLITSTVGDVLEFARMHLKHGVARDGTRIIGEDTATSMTEFQAEVPDKYILGDSWGLGWIRFDWNGHRLYGHDGSTLGQNAYLRIDPSNGIAVSLMTNGGHAHDLYRDLYGEIFSELAGLRMPQPLEPSSTSAAIDVTPHLGRYERASTLMEIFEAEDGPRIRATLLGPLAELTPDTVEENPIVGVAPNLFAMLQPGTETWMPLTFYSLPTGENYLHFGARATPKTEDQR